ncbi:MAG: hypothetical protein JRG92_13270 [Deltaproteobacteria bacterium]|nr:hypothetical protein [Deltaproteobacteria bacterium]
MSDRLVENHADCRRQSSLVVAQGRQFWRPAERGISFCRRILCLALFALYSIGAAQMQGLDEQVQEIKSDVLRIAAELSQLEETLLYPSNTQVAVFVSLAHDETSRLDSVQIQIDGEPVAHHIYSYKELEALKKGGVQRIYTGNLPTGEHRLDVSISGKLRSGRDFSGKESFRFDKDVEPELVTITLGGTDLGGASIQLGGL